ncbi:leucine-rich repeat domain-containing protein [Weissella confusa]
MTTSNVPIHAEATLTSTATDDVASWVPDAALRVALQAALGKGTPLTKDNVATITQLNLTYDGITNLSGLEFATNLRALDLTGNTITDITPLQHLHNLTDVSLRMNKASVMPDLTPLAGTPVKSLNLVADDYGTQPDKMAGLAQLTSLEELEMQNNDLTTVPPVTNLPNLSYLGIAGNKLTSVQGLAGMHQLTALKVGSNQLTDYTPIASLTNLTTLLIGNNRSNDISMLRSLVNLQEATFSQMGLTNNAVQVFSYMPKLVTLSIDFNDQISDLTPLAGLRQLQSLNFSKDQVADLTPLKQLTNLTDLSFSNAQVANLAPLAGLTKLTSLNLLRNHVSDLSPLQNLQGLSYLNAKYQSVTNAAIGLKSGETTATVPLSVKDTSGNGIALQQDGAPIKTVNGQVTLQGVKPDSSAFLAWDNKSASGINSRLSGTVEQPFTVKTEVAQPSRLPVTLAVLKGDGSNLTSVASNYIKSAAMFDPDKDGTGTLTITAKVPANYGPNSITFTSGRQLSANLVGSEYIMTYAFDLTAEQVAKPLFIENMHVDFRTGSFVYDNWYDVTFRLEGMPGAAPLPPVKESTDQDTTVAMLTEGVMRPETPQKQIKAQVVKTAPVAATQFAKTEKLVKQSPIVAAGVVPMQKPVVMTKADEKPAAQVVPIKPDDKTPTVVTKSQPAPTGTEPQTSTEMIIVAAVGSIVIGLILGWAGIDWWGKRH